MRKSFFALACTILAPVFLVGVTTSAPYDAWSDLDGNGKIDIFDIVKIAAAYGTMGDPGRNVTIVNWPRASTVTVWFQTPCVFGEPLVSSVVNTGGYSTLHLNIYVSGLTGSQTAEFQVIAPLYDAQHVSSIPCIAYRRTFTETDSQAVVTMPIPMEEVSFSFDALPLEEVSVCLSYYLTWT